ncbi:hypothetical protein M433DRAFT_132027 [Acidomyces richmondensis BFW]|nr:hypothetical protein M433DRAFT_132027 [Acidomyces richmondensis BFW]
MSAYFLSQTRELEEEHAHVQFPDAQLHCGFEQEPQPPMRGARKCVGWKDFIYPLLCSQQKLPSPHFFLDLQGSAPTASINEIFKNETAAPQHRVVESPLTPKGSLSPIKYLSGCISIPSAPGYVHGVLTAECKKQRHAFAVNATIGLELMKNPSNHTLEH